MNKKWNQWPKQQNVTNKPNNTILKRVYIYSKPAINMVKLTLDTILYFATCSSLVASAFDLSHPQLPGVNVECDIDTLRSCVTENSCGQSLACGILYEAYVTALSSISSIGPSLAEDLRSHFAQGLSGILASKITLGNDYPSSLTFKALSLKDETCADTNYRFEADATIQLNNCAAVSDSNLFCKCDISLDGTALKQKEFYVTFDPDVTLNKISLFNLISYGTAPASIPARRLAETLSSSGSASAGASDSAAGLSSQKRASVSAGSQAEVASSGHGSTWHGIRLFFLVVSFIGNAAFLIFVFWLSK
jgi:hypothetical protein